MNLSGFYFYLASIVVTNLVILLGTVRFQPTRFLMSFNPAPVPMSAGTGQGGSGKKGVDISTNTSKFSPLWAALPYAQFLVEGAQDMAFGYVLWWTLWTALIHSEQQRGMQAKRRGPASVAAWCSASILLTLFLFGALRQSSTRRDDKHCLPILAM